MQKPSVGFILLALLQRLNSTYFIFSLKLKITTNTAATSVAKLMVPVRGDGGLENRDPHTQIGKINSWDRVLLGRVLLSDLKSYTSNLYLYISHYQVKD